MAPRLHRNHQAVFSAVAVTACLLLTACGSTTTGEAAMAARATGTLAPATTLTATVTETVTQVETVTQTIGAPLGDVFSRKVFDEAKVARAVLSVLTGSPPTGYGLSGVSNVTCPSDQPVTAGTSFTCQVEIDGNPQEVNIDVKDDNGLYEVSPPS